MPHHGGPGSFCADQTGEPGRRRSSRIQSERKRMKELFRNISVGLGLAAFFAPGNLNATGYVTENIAVPFEFKVDKLTLPAGEYRVEEEFGKYIVSIVNV